MIGIYLLEIVTEVFRFLLIFHGFLGFNYRKGIQKHVLMLLSLITFSLLCFIPDIKILYLSFIIIVINYIITLFLYDEKFLTLTKVFIAISLVTVTWDSLFVKVISLVYDFDETISLESFFQQSLCNLMFILVLALILFITKQLSILHKLNYHHLSNTAFFLFLSSIALNAYINSMTYIISESDIPTSTGTTYVAMILLSILFQIVCISLVYLFYSREQYKTLNKLREEYNEKQIDYYKTLLAKEEDTRKFRHDIKNHFICIQELLATGKIEEAQSYIQDINDRYEKISGSYDTGNDIINAIINYYTNKGKDDHIQIKVRGRILQELNIPLMHLSTIFSNLMSNAYEASMRLYKDQDKTIAVEIRTGGKYLEFTIQNPTVVNRPKLDDKFLTSKSDRKNHGFGIRNMKEILSKYEGELQLIDDIDHVTVRVIMKIA